MKKIVLFTLSLVISCSCLMAQTQTVKEFYDKYTNDVKASDFTIQGWLLKVAAEYADDEMQEKC